MKTWLSGSIYALLMASSMALAEPATIDVNKADVAELVALPGVGKAKAEAIIAERDNNGPFVDAEDLSRVSGIGDAMAQKLKKHIEFTTPKASPTASAAPANAK